MRAIVTRPATEAAAWQRRLQDAGIDALALPLIDIGPPLDARAVAAGWERLADRRMVVFVSPNAVRGFFAARPDGAAAWPAGTIAAAPGPGTAELLRTMGIDAASVAEPPADAASFDSEALWAGLRSRDWRGARVLVARGDGGREWLVEQLVAAGATVDTVAAYRRHPPTWTPESQRTVDAARADPAGTAWLFSSSEAIGHLVDAAGAGGWSRSRAVATHPRIAERARDAGFGDVREASPTPSAVIACIQSMRP